MTKKSKQQKQRKQTVLLDHKQIGKRFVPPMLQLGSFNETRWVDHTLPELLWLGILNHKYGIAKGAQLGLLLAQSAVKATVGDSGQSFQSFALATAYTTLDGAQQATLLELLPADQLQVLKEGLIIFLDPA